MSTQNKNLELGLGLDGRVLEIIWKTLRYVFLGHPVLARPSLADGCNSCQLHVIGDVEGSIENSPYVIGAVHKLRHLFWTIPDPYSPLSSCIVFLYTPSPL